MFKNVKVYIESDIKNNYFEKKMQSEKMDQKSKRGIFIVIPALNEEKTICWVVHQATKQGDVVIVVDDGSTDLTAEMAKECGAIVLKHKTNLGKGAALRTGFVESLKRGAKIVVTLDADGQHDPREIEKLVTPILKGEADVVIGSRFKEKSSNNDMPLYRKIGNKILNLFTTPTRRDITDTQSGFRAYNRKALKTIGITTDGIGVDSQILMQVNGKNLRIKEVPIKCHYNSLDTSTYNPIQHTLSVITSIIVYITEGRPLFYLGIPASILLFISVYFFMRLLDIFNRTRYFSIEIALLGMTALFAGLMLAIAALILFSLGRIVVRLIHKNMENYKYSEYRKAES
ncbi:MAG: hypothetical protein DRJ38_03690 [Thermoprotei archaeon]|mgnify:CR=1 FL=1|nr:MAG: hypothetical protein DRJ38_03690 [Thermoprotei archaeon]